MALLLQTPSDYLLHERVVDELPRDVAAAALRELGLEHVAERDPRDLSGGERQRLALGVVLAGRGIGGGAPPAVSRSTSRRAAWTRRASASSPSASRRLAAAGAAVLVATHDVEFAARAARRCVLLGRGRVVADGSTREVLSGGRYFTTEVARVLGPDAERRAAGGGRVAARAALASAARGSRCAHELAGRQRAGRSLAAVAGMLWYERRRPPAKLVALVAALAALAVAARVLFAAVPNVQGTTDVALLSGYVLGPAPGFMVGALAALASNVFLGQGPWTPWQMVGWGAAGLGGALLASLAGRQLGRWPLAVCCGACGPRLRRVDGPVHAHQLRGGDLDGRVHRDRHAVAPVQRRARDRQLRPLRSPSARRSCGCWSASAAGCTCAGRRSTPAARAARRRSRPARADGRAERLHGRGRSTASVRDGVRYLERAQNADGGFGGAPRQASSQLITGWTVLGLEAARPPSARRAQRRADADRLHPRRARAR